MDVSTTRLGWLACIRRQFVNIGFEIFPALVRYLLLPLHLLSESRPINILVETVYSPEVDGVAA